MPAVADNMFLHLCDVTDISVGEEQTKQESVCSVIQNERQAFIGLFYFCFWKSMLASGNLV